MRAGSFVGRVGALAVAVGVGAAVSTGVAWAESDGSGPTGGPAPGPPNSGSPQDTGPKTEKKTGPKTPRRAATKAPKKATSDETDRPGTRRARKAEAEKPAEGVESETFTESGKPAEETGGPAPVVSPGKRADKPAVVHKPKTKPAPTRQIDIGGWVPSRVAEVTPKTHLRKAVTIDTTPVVQPTTVTLTGAAPAMFSFAPSVNPSQQTVKTKASPGGAIQSVVTGARKLVSDVLGALGWNTASAGSPSPPTGVGALVMGLLGWGSRREAEQTVALTSVTSPTTAELTVAPLAAVVSQATSMIGWVTGPNKFAGSVDNDTDGRFGIYGTDLGIMWDNGVDGDDPKTAIVEQHQVLFAFGDTFTDAASGAGWRSNVLLRSADRVLSDGISVPDGIVDPLGVPKGAYSGSPMSTNRNEPNYSRELIGKYPYSKATQVTTIPTGAISVPGAGANGATRQYIAYMSIKQWGAPGSWTTNYAAISYSDDNGQNWTQVPQSSVRSAGQGRSTVPYVSGNDHFQMISFVKPPEGLADAAAGYIYATGTPSGRSGQVYLSRVKEADILDVARYEYWDGKNWVVNKPSAATPFLPKTIGLFGIAKKTTAGELSLQYNTYLNKYVMLYTDSGNNVVLRTADSMNGTWSAGTKLVTAVEYPGLYAPMIHPWSGTDLLEKPDGSVEDPQYLYWNMSQWNDYNVSLMKTDLSQLGLVAGVAVGT